MSGTKAYRGGTGSAKTGVALPPQARTRRHTASVEPIVSASGFSWPTASTRRAFAIRVTTAFGTAGVHGERSITDGPCGTSRGHRRRASVGVGGSAAPLVLPAGAAPRQHRPRDAVA